MKIVVYSSSRFTAIEEGKIWGRRSGGALRKLGSRHSQSIQHREL